MLDHRVETFLTLCQTMHYTKTADLLHISQPTVTLHIQHLEAEYGCRLFTYSGKTLTLTEKGRILLRHATSMQAGNRLLKAQLQAKEDPALQYHFGATKTIGEYLLPDLLKRQLLAHPASQLQITVDNTQVLLQKLDRGQLDFALIEGFFDQRQYAFSLLRRELFLGVCAPSHPFAGRDVSLEELKEARLILREPGSGTREILEQLLQSQNLSLAQFPSQLEINHFVAIKELVQAGLGITFAYAPVVQRELAQRTLVPLRLPLPEIRRAFHFVCLRENPSIPRYAAFAGAPLPK